MEGWTISQVRQKRKIAIYGGSYNPPHKPHKEIVKMLADKFDIVFVVPCGTRQDKRSTNMVPAGIRIEMVKAAFEGIENVKIDLYDLENGVYTPTYLLEERYKKLFPNDEIWHVVGEDIIAGGCWNESEIHQFWDHGNEIWNKLNFLVIVRPGYGAEKEDLPPKAVIMEIKPIMGSGTLIRERLKNGKDINNLVDSKVVEIIKKYKLYQ